MIRILIVLPICWDAVLTGPLKDVLEASSEMCSKGEVITNSCLECLCSENNVYNCTSTGAPCFKGLTHTKRRECEPQLVYVYEETTCMCHKNGRWPHKRCREVFNSMPSRQTCSPNSYVIEDCNVCRCGPTGKIDRKHCTQNDCSDIAKRRSSKLGNVQGSCEPNNWYSLAPCQFCYCVHKNKLVCSTGNTKPSAVLELGAYNLTVCGKQMIKEVIELVPEVQRSLRDGSIPPLKESTKMTLKDHVDNNHKTYVRVTPKTVSPKPTRPNPTHKKMQVTVPDERKQHNREERQNVKKYNKDADSDSSDEDDTPIVRTSKFTRKPIKRQQSFTTTNRYKEDETSEESMVSDKPKIAEETTTLSLKYNPSVNKKTHLKIPLSAKVTFENVVDTQQPKPNLLKTASGNTKDDVYKINIPSVLDKILSMSLKRRSMVKLKTQSNCVPGQTIKEGCNNCFCLANGKLLCTQKPCNGTISQ